MGGVVLTDGTATVTVAFVGAVVAALSWLGKSAISAVVWYHGRRTREMEMIVADGRKANGVLSAELERVRDRRRLAGIALIVLLLIALSGIVAAVWAATSIFGALMGAGLPSVEEPGG